MFASSLPAQTRELMHDAKKITHLGNSAAIPSNSRFQGAIHNFEVHVQGKALSELSIDLPKGVSIRKGIDVTNKSGQKIETAVSVNDRKASVLFTQPVPPETTLLIKMRGVSVNTLGYRHIWMYRFYGKMVGLNAEISLGSARIQTHGGR